MSSARSVTARFEKSAYRLTVAPNGGGGGTVTGGGLGPCVVTAGVGAGCTSDVPYGTTVTLSAAADGSSLFQRWGGSCSGTGTCSVTMLGDRTVAATLEPSTYPINVTFTGPGSGTVSWPGGSCTSSCSASGANGSTVALEAAANSGFVFAGWTGSCSGTGACSLALTSARTVAARFENPTYRLTVTPRGTGSGVVSGGGLGPCVVTGGTAGAGCAVDVPYGTAVTLTAAPSPGSLFTAWGGSCAGTDTCGLTLVGNRTAVVTFDPAP
jgi:hypothetical protein